MDRSPYLPVTQLKHSAKWLSTAISQPKGQICVFFGAATTRKKIWYESVLITEKAPFTC